MGKCQLWQCNGLGGDRETLDRVFENIENAIIRFKADLYDFYAKAGILPDYEGRSGKGEQK